MANLEERRYISRLSHRFGFGPRPGEFESLLDQGPDAARSIILARGPDNTVDIAARLGIKDLGPQPKANSIDVVPYAQEKRRQFRALSLWWLDEMVTQSNPIRERMTWFWHGHWATSYQKVDDPLVMLKQNQTLRKNALGNFSQMAAEMVVDGALIYWLDGQTNTLKAPNENLSRELMELFTLGVNRYSEEDVKEVAKALTGYRINKSSGAVTFVPKLHYQKPITFLGMTGVLDAPAIARYLVERDDCATFISERMWYRFISSRQPLSTDLIYAFGNREIAPLVDALSRHKAMWDPQFSQVKSPVEWLVSALKALSITPSTTDNPDQLLNTLDALGQRPFLPPNVGGWPADEAWLSTASAQYRISIAQVLVKKGVITPISSLSNKSRTEALANLLGVASWSDRTRLALEGASSDPARMIVLGLSSPEFVVNA